MENITQNIENINNFKSLEVKLEAVKSEYYRLYRQKNRDHILQREREYRKKNKDKLNAYMSKYNHIKRQNNMPHIPWRSIEEDGLPKLVKVEPIGDEEISRYESDPCLVYLKDVEEEYLEYEIAQYIKCEYTDGIIESAWYEFKHGTEVKNVTHWSKLPQPPKGVME